MHMSMAVIGVSAFASQLQALADATAAQIAVPAAAQDVKAIVQSLAPVETGEYQAGISTAPGGGPGYVSEFIGSNHPAARRLERGFTGLDSMGRFYDDPPRPHWGPARDAAPAILRAHLEAALGG